MFLRLKVTEVFGQWPYENEASRAIRVQGFLSDCRVEKLGSCGRLYWELRNAKVKLFLFIYTGKNVSFAHAKVPP